MSNKIGRIISEVRRAPDQIYYKLDVVTADLYTVVETLQGIAIDATYKIGDIVHLNVVQGRHYIVSSKSSSLKTLRILGKSQPTAADPLAYFTPAVGLTPPDTLMYVAHVLDNEDTHAAIIAEPDAEIDPYPIEDSAVLCRLLAGDPAALEFAFDQLISAYAVEGMYFATKTKVSSVFGQIKGKHLGGSLETGFNPELDPQPDTLEYVVRLYTEEALGDAILDSDDPLPAPLGAYELVRQLTGEGTRTIAAGTVVEVSYVAGQGAMNVPAPATTVPCKIGAKDTGTTYAATLYMDGLDVAGEEGQVVQVSVNEDQTIPVDTWAMASLNPNGIWYVQVAVWL